MIRGIHKNIITIKDTGSDLFEEAIFVLKPKKSVSGRRALKREALKIMREKSDLYQLNPGTPEWDS